MDKIQIIYVEGRIKGEITTYISPCLRANIVNLYYMV
jgi:hypothetical protein